MSGKYPCGDNAFTSPSVGGGVKELDAPSRQAFTQGAPNTRPPPKNEEKITPSSAYQSYAASSANSTMRRNINEQYELSRDLIETGYAGIKTDEKGDRKTMERHEQGPLNTSLQHSASLGGNRMKLLESLPLEFNPEFLHLLESKTGTASKTLKWGTPELPRVKEQKPSIKFFEREGNVETGQPKINPERFFIDENQEISSELINALENVRNGGPNVVFGIDKEGNFVASPETLVPDVTWKDDEGNPIEARLGHVGLVGGKELRISGEISMMPYEEGHRLYDPENPDKKRLVLINKSGRYGRSGIRTEAQLLNVDAFLAKRRAQADEVLFRQKVGGVVSDKVLRSAESSPLLIIGHGKVPPQWMASLENWCRNATGKEQSGRLEAAKRVLQKYLSPDNANASLDLSQLDLTTLPPGLSHLSNLQELNVSKNLGLRKFPEDLGNCAALRSIDASSCSIDTWPACLSALPSLKTLLLDDNPGLRVFPEQLEQCRALTHWSMEATMPKDYHEPPIRVLPFGESRGRTLVRSASSSPARADGAIRARSMSPSPHATAPSAATMFGTDKARQLDTDFGSLQWPFRRGEPALKNWELDDDGTTPLMLKDRIFVPDEHGNFENLPALLDLEKLKTGEKKYIWTMSKLGRLIISEEYLVKNKDENITEPSYIGHPAQLGGGRGRISGELTFINDSNDPLFGKFAINNASGRYSKFVDRDKGKLENVAKLFRKAGLDVEIKYKQRDKLQPVIGLVSQAPEPALSRKS